MGFRMRSQQAGAMSQKCKARKRNFFGSLFTRKLSCLTHNRVYLDKEEGKLREEIKKRQSAFVGSE